jgi:integrase
MDAYLALDKPRAVKLLNAYLDHMEAEGKAPATRSRAKQAVCSIVDKLYVAGSAPWTLRGLALVREPEVTPYQDTEGLPHEAWIELLSAAESDGGERGTRDVAILLLLHDSALRAREVATLRPEDYDAPRGSVKVWQKGHDVRNRVPVRLTARTARALNAWCTVRPVSRTGTTLFLAVGPSRKASPAFLPRDVAYVVRYWCRRAGIPAVGPHKLRVSPGWRSGTWQPSSSSGLRGMPT